MENSYIDTNKYFVCFSSRVLKYLQENGLKFIIKGVNDKNNKPIWLFERTDQLNNLMENFK
jgi:hypothetical protein